MRKTLSNSSRRLLLALLLLSSLLLNGCGRPADTSGLAGRYSLVYASEGDSVLTAEGIEGSDLTVLLEETGLGQVLSGQERGRLTWRLSGSRLTIDFGRIRLSGELEERGFSLTESNSGALLRFQREQATATSEVDGGRSRGSTASEEKDSSGFLPADERSASPADTGWYGWWRIEDSVGDMPESWYDCCAVLEAQEDRSLMLTLWDENGSRARPLSEVRLQQLGDGSLRSLEGYFLFETVREGDWLLPDLSSALWLEGGTHETEGESFHFGFYLRPWGDRWSDAPEGQLPFYFTDWYLPLVEAGTEMPDEIPWEMLELDRAS